MPSEALFTAQGIETGYGRVQVLWGIDAEIAEGKTVLLLGANGAGKTTLLRAVMGLLPVWRGAIFFAGADITKLRPDRRVARGIAFMSEMAVFTGLTVDENLQIGAQFLPRRAVRAQLDTLYASFPALTERRRALAGSLSGGQRKMLGIAKALAGKPRLLVMDEPSAGLSPLLVKEVIQILARFRGAGATVLVAEQNIKFLDLADHIYILDGGRVRFSGTKAGLQADDALRRAYFGLQ